MSEAGLRGIAVEDRYELAEPLDGGAVGELWRAGDSTLGGEVAVQLLTAREPDPAEARARFEQAAGQLTRLDSPHLPAVVGHGTTELPGRTGVGYLVLTPPRGRPLGRVLREQGTINWQRALAWMEQICAALAAAHAAGLAHGTLQPSSVLLDDSDGSEHGTITVLDTALAELDHAGLPPANARHAGAVPYLAPERQPDAPADACADVYAAGCLLYELLVGRPPYAGTVTEVLEQHRESLPLRPSRAVRTLPEAVDDLVFTLMAREPGDRPVHAGQAASAIAALRTSPQLPAPRPGAAGEPPADIVEPGELPADVDERDEEPRAAETEETRTAPAGAAAAVPPGGAVRARRAGLGRRRQVLAATGAVLVAASGVLGYLVLTAYDQDDVAGSVQRAVQDLNNGELNDEDLTLEEAAEQALDDHSGWLRLRTSGPHSTIYSGPESDAAAFEVTNLFGQHPVCMRVATVPGPAFVAHHGPGGC